MVPGVFNRFFSSPKNPPPPEIVEDTYPAQNAAPVRKFFPCKVEEIVGKSIHIFHKNPPNVERVLGAGGYGGHHKLPHKTVIEVGPEKLDLEIEPMTDKRGNYIGVVVLWGITTKKMEALQRAFMKQMEVASEKSWRKQRLLRAHPTCETRGESLAAASIG